MCRKTCDTTGILWHPQEMHELLVDADSRSSQFISCAENNLITTLPPSIVSVSTPAFATWHRCSSSSWPLSGMARHHCKCGQSRRTVFKQVLTARPFEPGANPARVAMDVK